MPMPRKYGEPATIFPIRMPVSLRNAIRDAAIADGNRPMSEIIVETLQARFAPPEDAS